MFKKKQHLKHTNSEKHVNFVQMFFMFNLSFEIPTTEMIQGEKQTLGAKQF